MQLIDLSLHVINSILGKEASFFLCNMLSLGLISLTCLVDDIDLLAWTLPFIV